MKILDPTQGRKKLTSAFSDMRCPAAWACCDLEFLTGPRRKQQQPAQRQLARKARGAGANRAGPSRVAPSPFCGAVPALSARNVGSGVRPSRAGHRMRPARVPPPRSFPSVNRAVRADADGRLLGGVLSRAGSGRRSGSRRRGPEPPRKRSRL
ncbi:hypothetical protein SMALB_0176 [Streptomyces malaysiensis]|uniref:Uncharacterized protein n=1 Tax=Streptomyces malaysiensis TaxID=92644 RepID=A0A7X6AUX9_STRMQ|nr:hypothetical protein [Streptomyces malaysiensis]